MYSVSLYQFPWTVITNYYKCGGLEQKFILHNCPEVQNQTIGSAPHLPKAIGKKAFLASSGFCWLKVFLASEFLNFSLWLEFHIIFSLCLLSSHGLLASLCLLFSKETCYWIYAHPNPRWPYLQILNYIFKDPFSKSHRFQRLGAAQIFGWPLFNPMQPSYMLLLIGYSWHFNITRLNCTSYLCTGVFLPNTTIQTCIFQGSTPWLGIHIRQGSNVVIRGYSTVQ